MATNSLVSKILASFHSGPRRVLVARSNGQKKEEFVNYSKLLSPKKAKPRVTQTVSRKSSPKKVEPQKLVVDFYSMAVLYIGDNRFQLPHPRISLSLSSLFSRRAKVLSACCGWLVWHLGCVSVTFALMIFTLGLMEWLESKVVRHVQVQFRECNSASLMNILFKSVI